MRRSEELDFTAVAVDLPEDPIGVNGGLIVDDESLVTDLAVVVEPLTVEDGTGVDDPFDVEEIAAEVDETLTVEDGL